MDFVEFFGEQRPDFTFNLLFGKLDGQLHWLYLEIRSTWLSCSFSTYRKDGGNVVFGIKDGQNTDKE